MTTEVPLVVGGIALVDDEDAERVLALRWTRMVKGGHVICSQRLPGRWLLHRFILDAPDGVEVDHINRNPLDNRKENLRYATRSQQMANRSGWSKSRPYKGVHQLGQRWRASSKFGSKTHHLGMFDTAEEAAKAYDAFARNSWGEYAFQNFPEDS